MNTAEILALIERLEADLAVLKKAIQPANDEDDDAVVERARLDAARMRAARGSRCGSAP